MCDGAARPTSGGTEKGQRPGSGQEPPPPPPARASFTDRISACFCGGAADPRPAAGPIGRSLSGACAPCQTLWGGLFPVAERRARSAWFPRRRSGDPSSMVPRRRKAASNPKLLRLPLRRSSRGTSLVLPLGGAVALAAHNNPELTLKWRCRPGPRPPGLAWPGAASGPGRRSQKPTKGPLGGEAARREAPLAPPPHVSRTGPALHVAGRLAPHVAPAPAPCGTREQPIGLCGCRSTGGVPVRCLLRGTSR